MQYVRHSLLYRKIALTAVITYAISNTIGFALLTGSAIRYRLYSTWGLSALKITNIVAFYNLSFWLGLFTVSGVMFLVEPMAVPSLLHLPFACCAAYWSNISTVGGGIFSMEYSRAEMR